VRMDKGAARFPLLTKYRRAQADKLYLMSGSGDGEESRELLQQALMAANLAVMRAPDRNADPVLDEGLTLALAYRSRASILIRLGEGEAALNDLKLAINFGLELKSSVDYYLKMAKAYAGGSAGSNRWYHAYGNPFIFSHGRTCPR